MLRKRPAAEAVTVLGQVLDALLATIASRSNTATAALVNAVGNLRSSAPTVVYSAALGAPLGDCFDKARVAGASLAAMAAVRAIASSVAPDGQAAKDVATAAVRLSLVQEARILGATKFTSRNDIDAAIIAYDTAFEAAQDYAAANSEANVYTALVTLHAALMNDLTTRSRPLPQLVAYGFGRVYSALGLAYRLYGDASRAEELVAENKAVHPVFMPLSGTALSA